MTFRLRLVLTGLGGLGVSSLLLCLTATGTASAAARLWLLVELVPLMVVAVLLLRQRPSHGVARLLALVAAALGAGTVSEGLLNRVPASMVVVAALQVVHDLAATTSFAALAGLLGVFPTGVETTPASRWLLRALLPLSVLPAVGQLLTRRNWAVLDLTVWRSVPAVFPLHVSALDGLRPVAMGLSQLPFMAVVVGIVLLARRRGQVAPELDGALRWVWRTTLAAVAISVVVQVLQSGGAVSAHTAAMVPCFFLIPIGMGVATLHYDAFSLDLALRRTVVYGLFSVLLTGGYVGCAALLGVTAGSRSSLPAAVALAVLTTLALAPLRRRLDERARSRLFGRPVSGYDVLTRVGATLEHAYDLAELAPRLAQMVRDGLDLRWARLQVVLHQDAPDLLETLGEAGDPQEAAVRAVPLTHSGLLVGVLECGPRASGVLRPQDDELLASLARQAALAIHNARLAAELAGRLGEIRRQAAELEASRTRLVVAQDGERQRLERDLHDGAQQEIVALMAKLRIARNRLARGDDAAVGGLLDELQGDARGLLEELRELAHGIRPPVLADRGLVGAIEARASRLPLDVQIFADPTVRAIRYTDDIEAAAWFAVAEACANALKHSGAQALAIAVTEQAGCLRVTVRDDGCGIAPTQAANGLRHLRDRVEAVGGVARVGLPEDGGTEVSVQLPARHRDAVTA